MVFWSSKKQKIISISITKVEYIVLGEIKRFINKIKLKEVVKSLTLYGDNQISSALTKNAESQYYIKYSNIQYNYIQK